MKLDGSWTVKPRFDFIAPRFGCGVVHAVIDGKEGFIYRDGTWAIEPQDGLSRFTSDTLNGQWRQRNGSVNIIE